MICTKKTGRQAACQFNLPHKLKRTKTVLTGSEVRETEMEVGLYCQTVMQRPEMIN